MIADVEDNDDGTYTASFTPSMKGDFQVNVTLRGKHIQGSPFDLQVSKLYVQKHIRRIWGRIVMAHDATDRRAQRYNVTEYSQGCHK